MTITKLDEAHSAAWEAFDTSEGDMEQAIQAAVKVLVPKARPDYPHDSWKDIHDTGYNACRAEILKNAGVE